MTTHRVVIGNAEMWHGDCRDVLPLVQADACVSDPPYGIEHRFGEVAKSPKGARRLAFDFDGPHVNEMVFDVVAATAEMADAHFWFCGLHQVSPIAGVLRSAGLVEKPAAWVKKCPPPPKPGNWWPSAFEHAVYAYRAGAWFGDNDPTRRNVFVADGYRHGVPGKENHPTQKPLGLMERIVTAICPLGGTVLDPFMGSASTGVAAILHGRRFIGVEIDRAHFDTACERMERAQAQAQLFPAAQEPAASQLRLESA